MTSAISSTPNTVDASNTASASTHSQNTRTSSPSSGAVPAQHPVRSYATATKTATPPSSAGASQPAHNAKPASDNQMNGAAAQGGSQPTNSSNGMNGDHSRKPSVVINASGATGQYPNGGPVQNGSSRPAISFGSMNASGAESQPNAGAFHHQSASLQASRGDNPRVTSPAHSPSPIPQPAASGGRPPSMSAQNNGGLAFGSIAPDTEMMRGQAPQGNMASLPMHERRTSSNSMHGDQGMPRPNFPQGGAGRGRGFPPQQPGFMGSPAQRNQMPYQPSPNMRGPQFQPQPGAPGSPFRQPARASPSPMHAQPHMSQGHPMHYGGYPQHLGPQQQQAMYGGMPYYDPSQGYHQPYYGYQGYQPNPQSPRPQYPSPYQGPPAGGMQPPFHPPSTPGMARTPSQASERPPSSIGHSQTPVPAPGPSQTPISGHQQQPSQGSSSNFIRPAKKSSAIKITDAQGNAVDFKKPATPVASAAPQTPVIVSTPNAQTPPPRAPSTQHNRTESKTTKSTEETKNAFAEQVKRRVEEERKQAEAAKAKEAKTDADAEVTKVKETNEAEAKASKERAEKEEAAQQEIKKAAAQAEESAAKAAADKKAEEEASAAKKGTEESDEARKKREEQEEEERLEREIAEMEAKEKEEEERERAYQEKKAKQKAEAAAKEAERAKNTDEDLKRQEREAEAREEAKEREREQQQEKSTQEPDDEAKSMFASLKRPTLGPGASAPASGTETPASGTSEQAGESDSTSAQAAPAAGRVGGAQKPKPAHLKLETTKNVERAEPTPGMQALKSARFLEIKEEAKYPEGFKSPNPALNQSVRKGRAYDKDFLLQFQSVFKEKPSVDWDQKVKDTLGPSDEPGSARGPASARPASMGGRQGSRGGNNFAMGGAMGQFGGGAMGAPRAPVPSGTTSEQRFQMSNMGGPPRPGMPMARGPSQLGMGAPGVGMSRQNSMQIGPNSPRQQSARGKGGSKRDDRQQSKRQEQEMANKMPLTAHMEIAPLEKSTGGWKATSIGQPTMAGPAPGGEGNMAPDMVQRKVKAALNKMTPEKFDKISDQILEIAAQSKNESDGRTLRQVIQLTFEKACDEAHWAGMYAKFCHRMLTAMSNEIRDETIKDKNGNPVVGGALFRKYLLNRCQEEFERGWQVNLPEKPEGETQEAALLTDEYYVAAAAKRRGLGLIQFIGQLYKLRMLTLRIMHECVMRLLNFEGDPDEAAVENLTTLLKAVGASMEEEEQGRALMVTYFQRIEEVLLRSDALPSRPKFMIMDLVDLRKAGWKSKDDAKGPKTIQQIHEEAEAAQAKAEAERQRTQRGGGPGGRPPAGRGDARNFSGNMPPPVDYNRTNVNMDDLRKLQQRGSNRPAGGSLGPGGGLGPSMMGSGRTGSRRGNLGPGSNGTSRTNTPPVEGKKEEPSTAQNAFSALAALDPSGEQPEDAQSQQSEAASPPAARKEPVAADES